MSVPSELQFRCDEVQTLAYSALSGTYTQFTDPIEHAYRFIDLVNSCDADVYISFDGTTDNIYMPEGSFRIYDLGSNAMVLSRNTTVYARTTGSPSSGLVSVTGGYQKGT